MGRWASRMLLPLALSVAHAGATSAQGIARPGPRAIDSTVTLHAGNGDYLYLEAPSLYRTATEDWFFAKYLLAWRNTADSMIVDADLFAGLARDSSGGIRHIPLPDGFDQLLNPALFPQPGGVGVLWGRGVDSDRDQAGTTFFWAVWNGQAWTPPESIQVARAPQWDSRRRSEPVTRNDTLFIAAAARGEPYLSLLRRAGGRWTEQVVPASGTRMYVELAATERELLLLSIGLTSMGKGVLVQSSVDGGESWSEPVAAEPLSGSENAHDPALYPQPDGTVLGVWSWSSQASPTGEAIAVVSRRRDGRWVALDRYAPSAPFWGLWTSPVPGGFEALLNPHGAPGLQYVQWMSGRWCSGTLPGTGGSLPSPVWTTTPPGALQVFWGVLVDRRFMPATQFRRFESCCPSPR